ncbi:MAG TPA: hypothetical protein VL495_04200 [Edaphobacter sp.]|jgi:hypothetical protein|nr:hypothetical protein [Edaphobacter sp.]
MIATRCALTMILFTAMCGLAPAQQNPWTQVTLDLLEKRLPPAHLTDSQKRNIEKQVSGIAQHDSWQCTSEEDLTELRKGLLYEEIPLKAAEKTVIVTSGVGCARGGQGANGAMWLFGVKANQIHYLGELSGWGPGVLSASHAGYRDLVTGWHMSAEETGLSYYRFNGKEYKRTDHADAVSSQDGSWKITPAQSTTLH